MDGRERKDVRPGLRVDIVLKQDQRTGRLTRGVVKDVLTKSSYHPHGIKVRLATGDCPVADWVAPAAPAATSSSVVRRRRRM